MKKMTPIYLDAKAVSFCIIFFILGIFTFFYNSSITNLILLAGGGVFLILAIIYFNIPLWSYGMDGFEKRGKFYKWSDVKKIQINKLLDGFYFKTFDNKYFSLQSMVTKKFSKCGSEVLKLILKNNPQLKVPANFLKRINDLDEK